MNAEALIGIVLGTCTLQQLIGQGGMGAVFLAQQSRPRRQVAVKVLLPMVQLTPKQHAAFLERFRRETDAAASLDHPNILPVHEYGERDGLAYLVMPYVSGGTLRDELERERQLTPLKIVNYLDQMASALDAAHARGVIHRDIKPANILMTPEKRLLLSDFGLVKIISDDPKTPLTKIGMPMGTPDYMAPEQVIGLEVDARADIYSLGVILYQMITGETPFSGDLPMQVAMQHLHIPPPPPRQKRSDLPPAAEQVILRALAKRPVDRYDRAQDLANAFRLALGLVGNAGMAGEDSYGLSSTAQLYTPRGLMDPAWQNSSAAQADAREAILLRSPASQMRQREQFAPSASSVPMEDGLKNNIVAQTKMTLPSFTGLLSPQPLSPSSLAMPDANAPMPATAPKRGGETPLPPTRSLSVRKANLLRAANAETANASAQARANGPLSMAGMSQAGIASSPPGTQPLRPSALSQTLSQMSPVAPQMPFPTETPRSNFNPVSPIPANGPTGPASMAEGGPLPTGSLALPGEYVGQGNTATMRLTQSVKVVKMPVAGQPGRYVTGLLHIPTEAQSQNPITPTPPALGRIMAEKAYTQGKAYVEQHLKTVVLLVAVLLVLVSSSMLWLLNSHAHTPAQSTSHVVGPKPTPNVAATAAAQASATADANTILADPLSQNIHNWPVSTNTKGSQMYVFKDGAYHITDTNASASALALLPPDEQLPTSFVYTLTMDEIKGDDTTANNQFGLIFRLSTHQQSGKVSTTFYAFGVANTPGGVYQFWKYDDSYGANVNPWTMLWSQPFGKEYHYGHGTAGKNTFSIAMQGANFTFNVNGKELHTAHDDSLHTGQIGMLVNWGGTEVAFSNLMLTYK